MKLNEFKAWFEGFTESMEGPPNKKQWQRIQEQVTATDGVAINPTTYPVYIDRYVRPYSPYYYPNYFVGSSQTGSGTQSARGAFANLSGQAQNATDYAHALNATQTFDGVSAMYAAGKAESEMN